MGLFRHCIVSANSVQAAAASTIDEKLADAGTVYQFTGCCPAVAVHVLWDFSIGVDATATAAIAKQNGVRIGSINLNLRTSSASLVRLVTATQTPAPTPIAT